MNKSFNKSMHSSVAPAGGRNVTLPTIPSNVEPDYTQAQFNSIGYYGDLLSRLDFQIKTVETIYKDSFNRVQEQ